jgi:hypothetical protein
MGASFATDGKMDTRWGSRHQDGEWIEVDLQQCYLLDSIRLYWEAAYATSYEVLLSADAVTYESVYTTTSGAGGNVCIPLAASGRYVQILCHARNTGYGVSLWEIEVYGSGRCDLPDTAVETVQEHKSVFKFIKDGKIYISRNGAIYSVDGRLLMHAQE